MGKLPLLTPRQVEANLKALGFVFKNQVGSHKQYESPPRPGQRRAVVTVDVGYPTFSKDGMQRMIRQARMAGFSREEFCTGVASDAEGIPLPIVVTPAVSKPAKEEKG